MLDYMMVLVCGPFLIKVVLADVVFVCVEEVRGACVISVGLVAHISSHRPKYR